MATPTLSHHTLPGVLGEILIDIRTSDRTTARPAVLIVHGFKGFKDWGMFPHLAERIARAGFSAVSFNLSGSGVDQRGQFIWPERFGHNTYSAELEDVTRVIAALGEGSLGMAATERFGLVGHSRGGGIAILTAARERRIQALVTWAAIAHTQRWPGQEQQWRAQGKLDIVNTRTGQVLPLYTDVLDDLEQNAETLDLSRAAARIVAPWLILHGENDQAVDVSAAEVLAGAALKPPRVMLFPGADHTFGAVHPYAGLTQDLAQAIDETVKWLGRWL